MASTRASPATVGFFGVLLLLLLFFCTVKYGRVMHEAYVDSAAWQPVDAVVDVSSIVPARCGKGGDKFKVQLQYRYAVQGRGHVSDQIWFGDPYCGAWSGARDVATQFPVGAHVTAYADPAHPERAVLVRDAVSGQTWGTVILILVVLGVLLWTSVWLMVRRPPPREPPRPRPSGGF